MKIKDIQIKIKKYDRQKNFVIANIIVFEQLEIRGFVARFTTTKYSPNSPVWLVNPPSVITRNKKHFWVIRFVDSELWGHLENKIIEEARTYVNSL